MKKSICICLAAALCLCLLAGLPHVYAGVGGGTSSGAVIPGTDIPESFNDTWDLNNFRLSDISIDESGVYHITDSTPSSAEKYGIEVHGNGKTDGTNIHVTIYLEHVNIDSTLYTGASDPAIEILDGATVTLCFYGGTNTLKGAEGCAGIQKDSTYGELAVLAANDSSLDATGNGGAGIGGGSGDSVIGQNILINSGGWDGGVTATGTNGGAGIGGGPTGAGSNITVNCGDQITAASTSGGGAGIGGGRSANGSYITINGGDLVNASAVYGGAGIGGGTGGTGTYITINGGTVNASSVGAGAGIGGGCGAGGSYITIAGGTLSAVGGTNPDQQNGGAAIGGGEGASGDHITFSGGTTSALGGVGAAGVGSGSESSASSVTASYITISGGSLTATGCVGGAGIGGGKYGTCSHVVISGGTVTAKGGSGGGAGIGGGGSAGAEDIQISGGTVEAAGSLVSGAFGGDSSAGIGGGCQGSAKDITISGGKVHAYTESKNSGFGINDAIAIGKGVGGRCTSENIVVSTGSKRYAHITFVNAPIPLSFSKVYNYSDNVMLSGDIPLLSLYDPILAGLHSDVSEAGYYSKYFKDVTIEFANCTDSSGTVCEHNWVYADHYSLTLSGEEMTNSQYHYQFCSLCGATKWGSLAKHTESETWNTTTHQKNCIYCGLEMDVDFFLPSLTYDPGDGTDTAVPKALTVYMNSSADLFYFRAVRGSTTVPIQSVTVDGTAVSPGSDGRYSIAPDNAAHTVVVTSESGLSASAVITVCQKYVLTFYDKENEKQLDQVSIGYGQPYHFSLSLKAGNYAFLEVVCPDDSSKNTSFKINPAVGYTFQSVTKSLNIYITSLNDSTAPAGSIVIPGHTWTSLTDSSAAPVYLASAPEAELTASDSQSGLTGSILYLVSAEPMTLTQLQASTAWQSYQAKFALSGEGSHFIFEKLTDLAGNISYLSSAKILLDFTNPAAYLAGTETALADGNWLNELKFTVRDAAPCTVTLDGNAIAAENGVYSLPMTEKISVLRVEDAAGNASTYRLGLYTNKLVSVTQPQNIGGLPNGTQLKDISLPASAQITSSHLGSQTAAILWDTAGVSYDFANKKGGTFTVRGTLTLPGDVINPDGVSLGVSLDVTILEAPKYAVAVTQPAEGGTLAVSSVSIYAGETVTVTVSPAYNRRVKTLTVRDSASGAVEVTKTGDETYTYLQPADGSTVTAEMECVQPELLSVTQPQDIGGLANGTVLAQISLPETAAISTTDGGPASASIKWNLRGVRYDFSSKKGGTFSVSGAVILPVGVLNPRKVPLDVSLNVTILEAPKYPVTLQSGVGGTLSASASLIYAGETVTVTVDPEVDYKMESLSAEDTKGNALLVSRTSGGFAYLQPAGGSIVSVKFVLIPYSHSQDKSGSVPQDSSGLPQDGSDLPQDSGGLPSDVRDSDWFRGDVQYVLENSLMDGVGKDLFDPRGLTTRGMLVTVLYRLAGSPAVNSACPFRDVAPGSWYEAAIVWAAENDIAKGSGSGLFDPNGFVTREQAAAFFYRYAAYRGYNLSGGADLSSCPDQSKISAYARNALSWACGRGLMSGRGGGVLDPAGKASRCELAAFLHRFSELFGA